MVNNQSKKIISSLMLMLMMFSITLPVLANDTFTSNINKLDTYEYRGTDGNWYYVEFLRDHDSWECFTHYWVTQPDGTKSEKQYFNSFQLPKNNAQIIGTANYEGTNGKMYCVLHFKNYKTGAKYTHLWEAYPNGDMSGKELIEDFELPNYIIEK